MSIDDKDKAAEYAYLDRVLATIADKKKDSTHSIGQAKKNVVEARKHMWENFSHGKPDPHDLELIVNLAQVRDEMNWQERQLDLEAKRMLRLERQADSPYFGRIDFLENGSKPETTPEAIYVGTFALSGNEPMPLVYDWRAPVCSMFYESEVGPASYESPSGDIKGQLTAKRQYRIKNGEMQFMFDSSLKIDDDVLQEVLAQASDDRMRIIVASIQREQNRAIRDEGHTLLVVHGGAGSGKTSIALHRAAYLLYHNRDTMTANSIVIFSPNQIFGDYISSVLPELGEENVLQTTWAEYATATLGQGFSVETMADQMEFLLAARGPRKDLRLASSRLKSSHSFADAIATYVSQLVADYKFKDIKAKGAVILSAEEQSRLFTEEYNFLPPTRRLEKLARRAELLIDEWAQNRRSALEKEIAKEMDWLPAKEVRNQAKEQVREMVLPLKSGLYDRFRLDSLESYRRLFADIQTLSRLIGQGGATPERVDKDLLSRIARYTLDSLSAGKIEYEDSAPLLFLRNLLEGAVVKSEIKHVIIDEAQDYTPIHFRIFKQVFPWASFTVLGDLNQALNPSGGVGDFKAIASEMSITSGSIVTLTRTYRNTWEIANFAGAMLEEGQAPEPVKRSGPKPRVICVDSVQEHASIASDIIQKMLAEGRNTIAIITKTAKQAQEVKSLLPHVQLVSADDASYKAGVVLIPSYLAKGLEFDGVVVWDASQGQYSRGDRKILYTICTRALHDLVCLYRGTPSELLPDGD